MSHRLKKYTKEQENEKLAWFLQLVLLQNIRI